MHIWGWKKFNPLVCVMSSQRCAFITGVSGQDGSYLAAFLLEKGYEVHGLVRWDSYADPLDGVQRLHRLGLADGRVRLHTGDLTDAQSLTALVKKIRPDEIYNLAALSQVHVSFGTPAATLDINTKGTLAVLESVRLLEMEGRVRIYQASSSEMFGNALPPQNEKTPFAPCSPYGVAKLAAYWLARTYRDSYGMYAANGILFNHESPERGEDFVTRKVTRAAVAEAEGEGGELRLGNLDSVRDWGHAKDYVAGMWRILQQDAPDDYVLATGQAHTVRELVECAYGVCGIPVKWRGRGVTETGVHARTGKTLVRIDPKLFRPRDVNYLLGDAAKAREELGWLPRYNFRTLVEDMVHADREALPDAVAQEYRSWMRAG